MNAANKSSNKSSNYDAGNSSLEELQGLIKMVERQQAQLEIETRFRRNMALFKLHARPLYDRFINYEPQEIRIGYDNKDNLNLIEVATGKSAYADHPETFTRLAVKPFLEHPRTVKVHLPRIKSQMFFQHNLFDQIGEKLSPHYRKWIPDSDSLIGVMIVNGCGMGYHLLDLVENLNIYTLCIVDPHEDSFYASLHCIDWEPIFRHALPKGRQVKLLIGQDEDTTMTYLRLMCDEVGFQNIASTYIYHHIDSPKNNAFQERIVKEFHLLLTSTGFLEDERIGFAHTVTHLKAGIKLLNNDDTNNISDFPPAIIVGNGPSLDSLSELLRSNLDNAVIFSCGSSTGTLCNLGIKPDFHIEMERTSGTFDVVNEGTTEEFRQGIRLLCLNTVSPYTTALFDDIYVAAKANDAGTYAILREYPKALQLGLCNPTCTNMGLSAAIEMGFQEIYLIGVDLGMKDQENHHAKSSNYFDTSKKIAGGSSTQGKIIKAGNFGGEVYTNNVLDTSRENMEIAIRNSGVTVYNLNDGILIKHTRPLPPEDFSIPQMNNKTDKLAEILNSKFFSAGAKPEFTDSYFKKKYLKEFFRFRKHLKLPRYANNSELVKNTIDSTFTDIKAIRKSHPVSYMMLAGSFQLFSTAILQAALCTNREDRNETYDFVKGVYFEFLEQAFDLVDREFATPQPLPENTR